MQFSFVAIVTVLAAAVSAQIPSCAFSCLGQFQADISSTGCGAYNDQNMPCICAHQQNFGATKSCVNQACPPDQANQAIGFMLSKCN